MSLNFIKKESGQIKKAPTGFSFTTLFFGFLVPIIRGDLKGACLLFFISFTIIGWFVFPFIYNKMYINTLMSEGFMPMDDTARAWLEEHGIIARNIEQLG